MRRFRRDYGPAKPFPKPLGMGRRGGRWWFAPRRTDDALQARQRTGHWRELRRWGGPALSVGLVRPRPRRRVFVLRALGPARTACLLILIELDYAANLQMLHTWGASPHLVSPSPELVYAHRRLAQIGVCVGALLHLSIARLCWAALRTLPWLRRVYGQSRPWEDLRKRWVNWAQCRFCMRLWRLLLRTPFRPMDRSTPRWAGLREEWLFLLAGFLLLYLPFWVLQLEFRWFQRWAWTHSGHWEFVFDWRQGVVYFVWFFWGLTPLVIVGVALLAFGPGLFWARGPLRNALCDLDTLTSNYVRALGTLPSMLIVGLLLTVVYLTPLTSLGSLALGADTAVGQQWPLLVVTAWKAISLGVAALVLRGCAMAVGGYLGVLPQVLCNVLAVLVWVLARLVLLYALIWVPLKIGYGFAMAASVLLLVLI